MKVIFFLLLFLPLMARADSGCLAQNDKLRLVDQILTSIILERKPTERVTENYCSKPDFLFYDIQTDLRKYDPSAEKDFALNQSLRPALHRLILSEKLKNGFERLSPKDFCDQVEAYEEMVFKRPCLRVKKELREMFLSYEYLSSDYTEACKFVVAQFNKFDGCFEMTPPPEEEASPEKAQETKESPQESTGENKGVRARAQ